VIKSMQDTLITTNKYSTDLLPPKIVSYITADK